MLIAVLLPWLGLGVTDGFSGALRAAVRHTLSISKHCVTGEQPKLGGSGSVGLLGSTTLTFPSALSQLFPTGERETNLGQSMLRGVIVEALLTSRFWGYSVQLGIRKWARVRHGLWYGNGRGTQSPFLFTFGHLRAVPQLMFLEMLPWYTRDITTC